MSTSVLSLFPVTAESTALLDTIDQLEHIILSHTGEDVFDEVLKLLAAKLRDEERPKKEQRFRTYGTVEETTEVAQALLKSALSAWPGIFPEKTAIRLPPTVLAEAVGALASVQLRLTSLSILDAALERLLTRAAKGAMGQYFTPRNVIQMCIDVLAPHEGEVVVDPACGSGGFLLTSSRLGHPSLLIGFDFDAKAFRVAQLMAAANGEAKLLLSRRNSLDPAAKDLDGRAFSDRRMKESAQFADIIATNPPFGGDITDASILSHYASAQPQYMKTNGKMARELVFIERCVQMLKPGGRAAIVVPQGVLANGSLSGFREWLHDSCDILGVVGLHPYAFLPHTGVKTSVLFLSRKASRPSTEHPVFFAVSRLPGKDGSGRFLAGDGLSCYGNGDDLRAIATAFRAHLQNEGFDWARSTGTRRPDRQVDVSSIPYQQIREARRMDAEFFDPEILNLQRRLRQSGARDIRSFVSTNVGTWKRKNSRSSIEYVDISSVDQKTGQVLSYPVSAEEAPSRATYRIQGGDVLVSTVRPERNTVGLVTDDIGTDVVATNGFCVLRPQEVSPEVLFAFCKTSAFKKMVTRCATATMYPAVSEADILSVPLPALPADVAASVTKAIADAHQQLASARRLIAGAIGQLDEYLLPGGVSAEAVAATPQTMEAAPAKRAKGKVAKSGARRKT